MSPKTQKPGILSDAGFAEITKREGTQLAGLTLDLMLRVQNYRRYKSARIGHSIVNEAD